MLRAPDPIATLYFPDETLAKASLPTAVLCCAPLEALPAFIPIYTFLIPFPVPVEAALLPITTDSLSPTLLPAL